MFFLDLGCQHYLPDIRIDPWSDQIIDIINYIVIPHKVLPLQDLRVCSAKRDRFVWAGPFSPYMGFNNVPHSPHSVSVR